MLVGAGQARAAEAPTELGVQTGRAAAGIAARSLHQPGRFTLELEVGTTPRAARRLARLARRSARHGPDLPIPEGGYTLQGEGLRVGVVIIGVALAIGGLVAMSFGLAQNKRLREETRCQEELTKIYRTQQALGVSALAMYGGATTCLLIQFAF